MLAPPRVAPATAPRSIATEVPGRREAGPHAAGETFAKQTANDDQVKMTPDKMTPFGPGELNLALRIRSVLVVVVSRTLSLSRPHGNSARLVSVQSVGPSEDVSFPGVLFACSVGTKEM